MAGTGHFPLAQELVRALGMALRGSRGTPARLSRAACSAAEAGVPEAFLLPAVVVLRRTVDEGREVQTELPAALRPVLRLQEATAHRNSQLLGVLGDRAMRAGGNRPVLLGGAAALLTVYGDLGAFSPRVWIVGVPGSTDGRALDEHLRAVPGAFGVYGLDDAAIEDWTVTAGALAPGWLLPSRAAIVALGAARIGDPLAHPQPPTWFHVATAITAWSEELTVDEVVDVACRLGVTENTDRGLAILHRLFPELTGWLKNHRPPLSFLERVIAIPVAAHKLVALGAEAAPPAVELDSRIA